MLSYLHVRGLALLDDVALELASGMNVLTGETGAGKSIIVDALALLRGARGRAELVRTGEESATVNGEFELVGALRSRVGAVLAEGGLPTLEEGAGLLLGRVVQRAGRGRALLQSSPTTQALLAQVGEQLVDICSQHEHHSLTHVGRHLELLDGFAALDAEVEHYTDGFRRLRDAERLLGEHRRRTAETLQRADFLRFQLEELERVAPEPEEDVALERTLRLLKDAQRWAALAQDATTALLDSDGSVLSQLGRLHAQAERGRDSSEHLARLADELATARVAVEEAASHAERLLSELEFEPARLEQAAERLHELKSLQRKHGCTLAELGARQTAMRAELDALDHAEEASAALEAEVDGLRTACLARAAKLHGVRVAAAERLARALEAELAALHIPRARLEARLELLAETELGPRGLDRCELLFSANPGETPAPLNRVASGGELSRVLLALKGVLARSEPANASGVATYVFDEVDAGVGGAVADAIAQRLVRAASGTQVLCITHLPQIAAYADAHFHVEKHVTSGRTVTRVRRLDREARVEELARMLGGARVTESAREHARQLLTEADTHKAALTSERAPDKTNNADAAAATSASEDKKAQKSAVRKRK